MQLERPIPVSKKFLLSDAWSRCENSSVTKSFQKYLSLWFI